MEQASPSRNITVSFSTLLKVVLVGVAIYFFYQVLDVLALIFVAVIISTALEPAVDWLQRYHIPRVFGVLLIYLGLFSVIALVLLLIVPPLVSELGDLASRLPDYYDRLLSSFSHASPFNDQVALTLQQLLQSVGTSIASASSSLFSTLASVFGGLVQFVATFVMAFYLVVQEQGLTRFIHSVTPLQYQSKVDSSMGKIKAKLGQWLRGQLLLMLIIGAFDYVGLKILGMDYALVLGLWAGLTEIIPYIGPILGAVPAIFLALSVSPTTAFWVAILFLVAQQLENNLVVPMVMKRAVGLNPVVSITVILVGARLGGIVGALMAIPVATAVAVVVSDVFESRTITEPPFGEVR